MQISLLLYTDLDWEFTHSYIGEKKSDKTPLYLQIISPSDPLQPS
jgi:hypothetical protein